MGYAAALALAKEGCKVAINGGMRRRFRLLRRRYTGRQVHKSSGLQRCESGGWPEKLVGQAAEAFGADI